MTKKMLAILEALTAQGDDDFIERGTPPYAASDVSSAVEGDLSNTVKTLKLLEREGLVVREVVTREVWNAILGGHADRKVVGYWNVATMGTDRQAADVWNAGADARSKAALAQMFPFLAGGQPQGPQV